MLGRLSRSAMAFSALSNLSWYAGGGASSVGVSGVGSPCGFNLLGWITFQKYSKVRGVTIRSSSLVALWTRYFKVS
jgi:hypothetical protein